MASQGVTLWWLRRSLETGIPHKRNEMYIDIKISRSKSLGALECICWGVESRQRNARCNQRDWKDCQTAGTYASFGRSTSGFKDEREDSNSRYLVSKRESVESECGSRNQISSNSNSDICQHDELDWFTLLWDYFLYINKDNNTFSQSVFHCCDKVYSWYKST